jgi:hypothetical protein
MQQVRASWHEASERGWHAQPAGPLVKHRVAGAVVHLQVQGRLSAARKILDHADDLRTLRSRARRRLAQACVPSRAARPPGCLPRGRAAC